MACFDLSVDFNPGVGTGISGLASVMFNKRIITTCGYDGTNYHSYVADSPDGVNFSLTRQGAFGIIPARAFHRMVVHDNRIFLTGGYDGSTALSDVWMSNDAENWTQIANNAFTGRYCHAMFSHDGRLWVIGGYTGAAVLNDCWCSYDGVSWKRLLNGYSILGRYGMGFCSYNNRMWMAAGINAAGTARADVYSSHDGRDWVLGQTPSDFPAVYGCTLTNWDNKMVLIGGDTGVQAGNVTNDLWYSFHGTDWILGNANVGFNVMDHAAVAFDEPQRLYVIGGYDGAAYRSEVWKTVGEEFLTRAW